MQPLGGLDSAFLALETATAQLHVAAVVVLDPPTGQDGPAAPAARFESVREMVRRRLHLVPQFRQRAVRLPLDLLPPIWVDDPDFDLDLHLRRASLPAPGGPAELRELVGVLLARPLPPDRPLWEMVSVEGLSGGRSALVAKLHHAILDGVSGANTMASFLDLSGSPVPDDRPPPWAPPPLPSHRELLRLTCGVLARQPEAAFGALRVSADVLTEVAAHNRRLSAAGTAPPPTPFRAPRTSLNGALSSARRFATVALPLDALREVRRVLGARAGGVTFNDVVLCAVGAAVDRLLQRRGEVPDRPLVALVPVSTRRAEGASAALGNQVSGMLVGLGSEAHGPEARLRAVAAASRVAKEQEKLAWGRLLDEIARATPYALTTWTARCLSAARAFDRVPPPFNLVVSTLRVPDVPLWCAGAPVAAMFPAGPIAHGVGLNVTTMTYRGAVHVGLVACRRLVPDLDDLAVLVEEAVGELVDAARSTAFTGRVVT